MNLDWLKRNVVIVVCAVFFAAGLAYGIWRLFDAAQRRQTIETELAAEQERLQGLLRAKPFPSRENLQLLRTDRVELEDFYQELKSATARPVEVPELTRVQFRALLSQKLRDLGSAAKDGQIDIPSAFAFGFDEYLGVLPPDDKQILRTLTKQLVVIENLSHLLFTNKVKQITKLGRESVVTGGDSVSNPKSLYETMTFDLEFSGDAAALQKFLNSLARSEWFFVVKTMDVDLKIITTSSTDTKPVLGAAQIPFPVRGPRPPSPSAPSWINPLDPAAPVPAAPRIQEEAVLHVKLKLELAEAGRTADKEQKR